MASAQRSWPALALISGIIVLAVFAFRSLYLIAAVTPVYDDAHKVVAMRPSPEYARYQRQQWALGVSGSALVLVALISAAVQRARRARNEGATDGVNP